MHREESHSTNRLLSSSEFDSRLTRALESGEPSPSRARLLLVGFGGLDDLVGDLGTEATRAALRALGERILTALPPHLSAARLFGDRFAVLVEGDTRENRVAEALFRALRTPVTFHGEELTLRPRFGIAKAETSVSAQDLLRKGTAALKRAECIGGRGPTLY
ncbi:MAG: diguanylate cyclase, partial [Planctomycetes bacterium]|nr:diguanylate cyclase [Planctomycetota bacterium]